MFDTKIQQPKTVVGLWQSSLLMVLRGMKSLIYHVLTGRWFMLFTSLLIMAASGAAYIFVMYSNEVKTSLGYDQSTLNLLSFFKDVGATIGIISGFVNKITPPWVVLSIGTIMNFFGYFMIWLVVIGRIAKPQVWPTCLFICIGSNSQTFANTGGTVTFVKNFPGSCGNVLGLLNGYVDLSGAIIARLFYGDHNPQALILLIAWFPAAVSFLFLPTLRILKVNTLQPKENKGFYNLLYISLALAGFLMVLIIIQNKLSFKRTEYIPSGLVVFFFLLLPLVVVFKEELNLNQLKLVKEVPPPNGALSQQVAAATTTCLGNILKPPKRREDYTILQALCSIDLLILFVATTFGAGGALTAIDNLGQIGHSSGYPSKSITTCVSLLSIWNYLGRVIAGYASNLLTKYKLQDYVVWTIFL